MELRASIIVSLISICGLRFVTSEELLIRPVPEKPEEDVIAMWMPRVNTTKEDEYHCMGKEIDFDKRYIKRITVDPATSSSGGAWKCLDDHPVQRACRGRSSFLFAWAKDAPAFTLPDDVAFQIGLKTNTKGLFIQVHYSTVVTNDNSGISLVMTEEPRKYEAGIMILAAGGQFIPPRQEVVNVNVMCTFRTDTVIHPFGFRTHAHSLGTVISGWYMKPEDQETGLWTMMGKQSPQNPQSFYPMNAKHNLTNGSILGARCVFNSTERDHTTFMGPTHKDEMCNFYMMYYAEHRVQQESCTDLDPVLANYQLPVEASQPLPADQVLGHHHHHEGMVMDTTRTPPISDGGEAREPTTVPSKRKKPGLEVFPELSPGTGREGEGILKPVPLKKNDPSIVVGMDMGAGHEHHETEETPAKKLVYEEMEAWSQKISELKLGQVSGVALDKSGDNVYIFHRASQVWNSKSFDMGNNYLRAQEGPIREPTIVVVDAKSGLIRSHYGSDLFYMPHGITVDPKGNVWVTDVALHQVFRLTDQNPTMILGKQFEPGHDGSHFCKPSSVAVLADGDFYVADGYCNSRVIRFGPDGRVKQVIGKTEFNIFQLALPVQPSPESFLIPHDIKLSDDETKIFVADREYGRVQAFSTADASFLQLYKVPEFGFKVFAIDVNGDLMVAVNGHGNLPGEMDTVQGILVNTTTGVSLGTFNSNRKPFVNPHAVVISRDRNCIYVTELNGQVHQFHLPSADKLLTRLKLDRDSVSNSTVQKAVEHSEQKIENPNSGYMLLMAIFCVPILILFCGITVCCFRKNQRTSQSKWKDMLYRYKPRNVDQEFGAFINKKQGFRPLRQEDVEDDDSEEEVFSAQKSHRVAA